jgi:hypothetical protein
MSRDKNLALVGRMRGSFAPRFAVPFHRKRPTGGCMR